ncbi:hypothetical protein K438DRAFT_2065030 [Mycena galopus ATCC 62051]|nr:hypothetical protein K438DRAFT_2065030 [Mycena galopus ATCC 62051]
MSENFGSPVLSHGLEYRIFELSAYSDPRFVPTLMRVAWRVNHWQVPFVRVEPLLYHTLVIHSRLLPGCPGFQACSMEKFQHIARTKPEGFLRDSVRNLAVEAVEEQEFKYLLTACSSVENLNLLIGDWDPDIRPLESSLRRLFCSFSTLVWNSRNGASFAFITHLALFGDTENNLGFQSTEDSNDFLLSLLVGLPRLTHLGLGGEVDDLLPLGPEILRRGKSLRALVYLTRFWPRSPPSDTTLFVTNPRVVVVALNFHREDWQRGVLTGSDFWARADDLIEGRLSGGAERDSFLLEDPLMESVPVPNEMDDLEQIIRALQLAQE